jgi:ribosomal protein S27E
MQSVSCPGCGAPVKFRSHASVMAVCEFCQATVLKAAGDVQNLGKMSSVLEDYSPIQIGTSGKHGSRAFDVVGRIQLRYDAGMWNEWYLLFQDGTSGWLGDSSGMYVMTFERPVTGALPDFDSLEAGNTYGIGGQDMRCAEIRTAQCIGGQGELPFRVGDGWQAKVADFRAGSRFATLDYSDGEQPVHFIGVSVTLEEMQCQLLRDDEQIKESAGKYRGKTSSLDCPSCGTSIGYRPGVTPHLVCPGCKTQLDASSPQAQVVAAGRNVESFYTSLALGAVATINGQQWQVIGAMRRSDDEGTEWTEYLVYNTRNAFFWLVETDEGWFRASVMPVWPEWNGEMARLDKTTYDKQYDYGAKVVGAVGAFNWRVNAGDSNHVHEYKAGQVSLAAELTHDELTWSRSVPIANDQLKAWFGSEVNVIEAASAPTGKRLGYLWWMLGLNLIPLILNFSGTWWLVALALLAIYVPMHFMNSDKGA